MSARTSRRHRINGFSESQEVIVPRILLIGFHRHEAIEYYLVRSANLSEQPMTEEQIRADIRAQLITLFSADETALIVEEMEVCSGSARIDMAVICDRLIGIEIKGPRDSLDRLPRQASQYSKCFDQVVLVVDSQLAQGAIALIPSWWGVVIGTIGCDGYRYQIARRPRKNKLVDVNSVLSLLWKNEMEILLNNFIPKRLPKSASRKRMRDQLVLGAQADKLKQAGVALLRMRKEWRSLPIA